MTPDRAESRRALAALQASEARYRALVEASTRMVWRTDPDGRVDDMPYWRELTGQSLEQVRGYGWLDALHPADHARVSGIWHRAIEARTVYEAEYRLRLADGSFSWFRARGAPVLGDDGTVLEWVGIFNDIDEERRQLTTRAFLERASEALVSALGVREALAAVARIAVQPVADGDAFADGVAVDVPRAGGGFERVAVDGRDPEQAASDTYSSLVVPMRARGATLGAITLVLTGPDRRRPYDAQDLAVAEELARRAGLALDNALRYEAEQVSALRARRLLAVTAGLGRALTPGQVADVIYGEGLAAIGADAGSLALVHEREPGEREFEVVRVHGYSPALVDAYRRFPLRAGRPLSDAVLAGAPVLMGSGEEWARRYPDVLRETGDLGFEAFAGIPIMSRGRAIAAISVSFHERVAFDDAMRTFLATLGEQCGLALERAQAFAAARRAEEASAFLAEASALLGESLEYEATLRAVAEAAVPRLGDWCAVDIVRDPLAGTWPPELDRVAVVHRDPAMLALGAELTEKYPTDWSSTSGAAGVLRSGSALYVPTVTDEMLVAGARDPEHLRLLRALRFSSIIVVPLIARGLRLGVLTLCHTESGRSYDAPDLALAEDLAHRAAVAVDNARLYRDAEKALAEAEAANRAKSQFLSTMSHELRTPLNAITGYVDLLDMGLRGPITEPQRDDLNRIRRGSKILMSLVNDVLNFARLEAGQVHIESGAVSLADVVAALEPIVGPQLRGRGLAFDRQVDPALVARGDADRVEQVLTNLLTNAIKFTQPGGRVAIVAGRSPGWPDADATGAPSGRVWVRVSDTGRGIPQDQLERIFEPFVQVDRHLTQESQQGVGLGLAISRDLARLMGGDLTVSSAPGQGSAFTLTLPAG